MFESFKNHPLTKDVIEIKECLGQMGSHVQDQLSYSFGPTATKLLTMTKSGAAKVVELVRGQPPVIQDPTPTEPHVPISDEPFDV